MPVAREDLLRREFDFAAADECGHLALVCTAGYGPVPERALAPKDEDALPDTEQLFLASLPIRGAAREEGRGPACCKEWSELGRRGVFVYDWRHYNGPYERLIVPAQPVALSSIPARLRALVATHLRGCFVDQSELNTEALSG